MTKKEGASSDLIDCMLEIWYNFIFFEYVDTLDDDTCVCFLGIAGY